MRRTAPQQAEAGCAAAGSRRRRRRRRRGCARRTPEQAAATSSAARTWRCKSRPPCAGDHALLKSNTHEQRLSERRSAQRLAPRRSCAMGSIWSSISPRCGATGRRRRPRRAARGVSERTPPRRGGVAGSAQMSTGWWPGVAQLPLRALGTSARRRPPLARRSKGQRGATRRPRSSADLFVRADQARALLGRGMVPHISRRGAARVARPPPAGGSSGPGAAGATSAAQRGS